MVSLSVGLLVAAAMVRGAAARTASILALVAFMLMASAMALRPQLGGIVLFAVLLLLVAARERHPRAYLAAPVVVLVWANGPRKLRRGGSAGAGQPTPGQRT